MEDLSSEMVLPMIALAEAIDIVNKGRTKIPGVSDLLGDVIGEARIEIYPLTFDILQQSLAASAVPEMHDRLIVATALYIQSIGNQVAVLTKDPDIIAAALAPIVW